MLTLAMVFSLFAALPMTAGAGSLSVSYGVEMGNDGKLYRTDTLADITAAMSSAGAVVTGSSGAWVLTLTDFNFTTTDRIALEVVNGTTIVLNGTNTVASTYVGNQTSSGIYVNEAFTGVTITGNGSLTATGGTLTASASSVGVYVYEGYLTISGNATVTATGGDGGLWSAGIATRSLTVSGGAAVTATGQTASHISVGIDLSYRGITISGDNTVIARGNTRAIMVDYIVPSGYRYWVNTTAADPGGAGTVSGGTFVIGNAHKYAKIAQQDTAPKITTHPKDLTVAVGGDVTFSVAASGGNLSYSWEVSNNNGASWFVLSEQGNNPSQETANLLFTHAQANWNGYLYRCLVSNSAGSELSNAATLTVTGGYVAVTDITGVPASAAAGVPLTLTGTVVPDTATNKAITWSVKSAGATGATISGDTFNATAAGTATITATVVNGATATTPYTKDFDVIVLPVTATEPGSAGSMSNFKDNLTYTRGHFTDVREEAWYGFDNQKVIALAYEYEVMQGIGARTFAPLSNYRISDVLAVAARIHSTYMTGSHNFVQGDPWYQVYVDYCIDEGIILSGDFAGRYRDFATRAEMVYVFARVLPDSEYAALNTVNKLPDVDSSTSYYNSIIKLYEAGVIMGTGNDGRFNPNNTITRAEASAIITRIILPWTRTKDRTYG